MCSAVRKRERVVLVVGVGVGIWSSWQQKMRACGISRAWVAGW